MGACARRPIHVRLIFESLPRRRIPKAHTIPPRKRRRVPAMRRLLCLLMFAPVLSASALLSGCGGEDGTGEVDATLSPGEGDGSNTAGMHPYQVHFDAVAKEFSVPASLLVAIGYAETQ